MTLAGNQLTACPECSDTVKFFTHPPAPNVISLFPGFCKHQRRFLDIRRESKELLLTGGKKPLFQNVFNQGSTIVSGKHHPLFFCILSQHLFLLLIRSLQRLSIEIPRGFCPSGLWDFNAAGAIKVSRVEMSHFAFLSIGPPEIGMGNVLHFADLPETRLTVRIEYRGGLDLS